MILNNVELHNIDEVRQDELGWQLQRVPDRVRQHLQQGAQIRSLQPANSEVRFAVLDEAPVRVTLSSLGPSSIVVPFFGDFQHGPILTIGPSPQTIELTMPERMRTILDRLPAKSPFAPNVARLMLWGCQVRFHGVEGNVQPPSADQLPSRRYLAYGTSITHGASASAPHLNYVSQAARRLGADLLNFGVGGACLCEPKFADYFAEREDWDFATLALSVNMVGRFNVAEFRERAEYVVNTVAGSDTSRPVLCITLYPHFRDLMEQDNPELFKRCAGYRETLSQIVADSPHPNVHIASGLDVLADYHGLTTDILHPSDLGMIAMGEEVANRLRPLIE